MSEVLRLSAPADEPWPEPGPPFRIGDELAFFPAELDLPSDPGWLRWDFAVIDDVNAEAESFGFHFASEPVGRHAQGMENIVRRTPNYETWRAAFEAALAVTGDPAAAHERTHDLRRRVLAEHPIHGPRLRSSG
jgi:hypothetical protein